MIGRLASVLLIVVSLQGIHHVSAGLPDWITSDMMDMVHDDKVECMGKFGTTQDIIDQAIDGKIANDPKLTCYMNCLFESFGMIDEDTGDFEFEMIVGFVPDNLQAEASDTLGTCSAQTGADACDKIYNIALCIYNKSPHLWFML